MRKTQQKNKDRDKDDHLIRATIDIVIPDVIRYKMR